MRFALLSLALPLLAAPLAAQRPVPARPAPPRTLPEVEFLRGDAIERLRAAQSEALVARQLADHIWAVGPERQLLQSRLLELEHGVRALVPSDWQGHRLELDGHLQALATTEALTQARAQAQGRLQNTLLEGSWSPADFPLSHGGLASLRPQQGTPEDSLYRVAREALNRGEYARASQLFQTFQERFPNARTAPAALYWRAFALYRAGSTDDLRRALTALETQRSRYPATAEDADAATLRVRINGALAARGDQTAAAALRAAGTQGTTCDREEMEVRAEALNALVQMDGGASGPILSRVLAQRDECSVTLRRRAVYILGRRNDAESASRLLDVARNDPDRSVRADAIALIGRMPGDQTIRQLEELFTSSTDERTQSAVFSALRSHSSPESRRLLRRFIERSDLSDGLRANAISALLGGTSMVYTTGQAQVAGAPPGGVADRRVEYIAPANVVALGNRTTVVSGERSEATEEDAAFVRGLYPRQTSRVIKDAIISGVARMGGAANEQWLMQLVQNESEEMRYRSAALTRMRTQRYPIEDVVRLYDGVTDRQLRSSVITVLGAREEAAATDKLFEIARSGTDPQLRRQAIGALSRKKDPRTERLLLDLLERR